MTVTLNLKPEVEAGLLAQARASGMTVEAYILAMVERALAPEATLVLGPEKERPHLRHGRPGIAARQIFRTKR